MVATFEVLAEPNRRRILDLLLTTERAVSDLVAEMTVSQPAVSKHLRVLRDAGLVDVRVDAQRRIYRVRTEPLRAIDDWLEPYRQSNRDEVTECLKKQGGLDKCALAFYTDDDLGNDKVWDIWRIEGPTMLQELSSRLGTPVEDLRVEHARSGIAHRVGLVGANGSKWVPASEFAQRLDLRSLRFSVSVLSLAGSTLTAHSTAPIRLHGFLRGIGGVVLQQRLLNGSWRQVARVHARPDGRFDVSVRPRFRTAYRLAAERVAGPPLEVTLSSRP